MSYPSVCGVSAAHSESVAGVVSGMRQIVGNKISITFDRRLSISYYKRAFVRGLAASGPR